MLAFFFINIRCGAGLQSHFKLCAAFLFRFDGTFVIMMITRLQLPSSVLLGSPVRPLSPFNTLDCLAFCCPSYARCISFHRHSRGRLFSFSILFDDLLSEQRNKKTVKPEAQSVDLGLVSFRRSLGSSRSLRDD